MSSNSKRKTTNHIRESGKKRRSADHDPQEESTSRATKLTHTMNEVVSNNKGYTDAVENSYNIENDDDNNENETVVNDDGDESCDTE